MSLASCLCVITDVCPALQPYPVNVAVKPGRQLLPISHPHGPEARQVAAVHDLTERTAAHLGRPGVDLADVRVDDGYVGEGYGIPAESTLEAIDMAARMEGLLLDPVYSGKGFAGMIGLTRAGFFNAGQNVLFLHTGGAAALFAYEAALVAAR